MTKPKFFSTKAKDHPKKSFLSFYSNPSELLLISFEVKSTVDEQIDESKSTIGFYKMSVLSRFRAIVNSEVDDWVFLRLRMNTKSQQKIMIPNVIAAKVPHSAGSELPQARAIKHLLIVIVMLCCCCRNEVWEVSKFWNSNQLQRSVRFLIR